ARADRSPLAPQFPFALLELGLLRGHRLLPRRQGPLVLCELPLALLGGQGCGGQRTFALFELPGALIGLCRRALSLSLIFGEGGCARLEVLLAGRKLPLQLFQTLVLLGPANLGVGDLGARRRELLLAPLQIGRSLVELGPSFVEPSALTFQVLRMRVELGLPGPKPFFPLGQRAFGLGELLGAPVELRLVVR